MGQVRSHEGDGDHSLEEARKRMKLERNSESGAKAGPGDEHSELEARRARMRRLLEDQKCAICSQVFIEPVRIRCGHTFCGFCLDRSGQAEAGCPTCHLPFNRRTPLHSLSQMIDSVIVDIYSPEEIEARKKLKLERGRPSQELESALLEVGREGIKFRWVREGSEIKNVNEIPIDLRLEVLTKFEEALRRRLGLASNPNNVLEGEGIRRRLSKGRISWVAQLHVSCEGMDINEVPIEERMEVFKNYQTKLIKQLGLAEELNDVQGP